MTAQTADAAALHFLRAPADSAPPAEIGNKAFNLGRLVQLGYNVPACVFLSTWQADRLGYPDSNAYLADIAANAGSILASIPSVSGWAVRSSATLEDAADRSLAGRFETRFIDTVDELGDAVAAVWRSARLADAGPECMGVVVQARIDADCAGVAFSVDPTDPTRGAVVEGVPGMGANLVDGSLSPWRISSEDRGNDLPGGLSADLADELFRGLARLARDWGCDIDAEWAVRDGQLFWLQARPLTGARTEVFEIPAAQRERLRGVWVRINHSLSPQAPLIATLNPGGYFDAAGWDSELVNRYHYIRSKSVDTGDDVDANRLLDDWDRFEATIQAQVEERERVSLAAQDLNTLHTELMRRCDINRRYFAEYSDPAFISARDTTERQVHEMLARADIADAEQAFGELTSNLGSRTEEKQARMRRLAAIAAEHEDLKATPEWQAFMRDFGYECPTTQLYYLPTLRETPELLRQLVERLPVAPEESPKATWRTTCDAIAARLGEADRADFTTAVELLRRLYRRTEDDDYLLARCTALVRYAILSIGECLFASGQLASSDDVFFLDAAELQAAACGGHPLPDVTARKRIFELAGRMQPPPMIINGRARRSAAKADDDDNGMTGVPASPGSASGIALVIDDPFKALTRPLPRQAVVVSPIVTPGLAYALIDCAALITESGGLASHGAIVAREMGVPAVVGVAGACQRIRSGHRVTVDGSHGRVIVEGAS